MTNDLRRLAREYVDLLEAIEKTRDSKRQRVLDERRVELHGLLMDRLKSEGMNFHDRDDATRIAYKIANGEL